MMDHSIENRVCLLDGCEVDITHRTARAKYCSQAHWQKVNRATPEGKAARKAYQKAYNATPAGKEKAKEKAKARAKTREFDTCQLDGCENSLEHKKSYAKHCCEAHKDKARHASPAGKAAEKAYRSTPEWKADRKVRKQQRRSQKAALPATFSAEDWRRCLEYWDHKCVYCGAEGALHQEHFIPLTKGGPYTPDNIVPACQHCNFSKHASDPGDWCTPEQFEMVTEYFKEIDFR